VFVVQNDNDGYERRFLEGGSRLRRRLSVARWPPAGSRCWPPEGRS
jgi:hypothetical protein